VGKPALGSAERAALIALDRARPRPRSSAREHHTRWRSSSTALSAFYKYKFWRAF